MDFHSAALTGNKKRLGLIVNPVAGLGGRVGLKGSDGAEMQARARALGAIAEAPIRVAQALAVLSPLRDSLELLTAPGEMGADAARHCGFTPRVIGSITAGATTAEDTRRIAQAMKDSGVDLLLFAGGDGTARDVFNAVGVDLPALGIPAGVKIHSAVYALTPRSAGQLALEFLTRPSPTHEAEVMDLDEEAYRAGTVSARLYGYLCVPAHRLMQDRKAPTPAAEAAQAEAIATEIVEGMTPECAYCLGPGTTLRAIATRLGIPKTLVGVDVVRGEQLLAADVGEGQLLNLLESDLAKIIVTPIGGQGFVFGRGNQQFSPRVLERVGRANVMVAATASKLAALGGRPLRVDTGDPALDARLAGYLPVITGYRERVIYRIEA